MGRGNSVTKFSSSRNEFDRISPPEDAILNTQQGREVPSMKKWMIALMMAALLIVPMGGIAYAVG